MKKEIYERRKPHINVGTIGHILAQKTVLTTAITLVQSKQGLSEYKSWWDINQSPEEQARVISIATAAVEYETINRHYAHFDCPGHWDYVHNAINGMAQMDAAILVVPANDGPMPPTPEHIMLARQMGVSQIVCVIDKIFKVDDDELVDLVIDETRDLLTHHGYPGHEIPFVFSGSEKAVACGCGLKECSWCGAIHNVLETMDNYIVEPERQYDLPFFMPIWKVLKASQKSVIAIGKVEQGKLRPGDTVEIAGLLNGRKRPQARVMSIEMFNKTLEPGAIAGDFIGVLLEVNPKQIFRGQVLSTPGTTKTAKKIQAYVRLLAKNEGGRHTPIDSGYEPSFFFRTARVSGTIDELYHPIHPGNWDRILIKLHKSCVLETGQKFIIREGGRTVALGTVMRIID